MTGETLVETVCCLVEAAPPDGSLLARFVATRDESAFETLLRRHGPMVLGVCRRIAGSRHDAEYAFQVTFLELERQANVVCQRCRVGYRAARKRVTRPKGRATTPKPREPG